MSVRKDPGALKRVQESQRARFLIAHLKTEKGAAVMTTAVDPPALVWWTREEVCKVSQEAEKEAIYLGPVTAGGPEPSPSTSGEGDGGRVEAFAVDMTRYLPKEAPEEHRWRIGRELLVSKASDAEVTIAGLALALTSWSTSAGFDGRSGRPTLPIEGGVKRQEDGGKGRVYPRTDPVAIGLIVSPDRQQILLNSVKGMPGFYTCISGFVDQCESVEDAFAREAFEEAGVRLDSVELYGSQAWPIGRGGSCELMIGCHAVASSMDLKVNLAEVADARWFGREEVIQMLLGTHPQRLWSPGPVAIAHHLIRSWADPEFQPLHRANVLQEPATNGMKPKRGGQRTTTAAMLAVGVCALAAAAAAGAGVSRLAARL